MIFNKNLSLAITACFFVFLLLLTSSIVGRFIPMQFMSYINVLLVIVFWMLSRSFYNYLRNDDFYKNNRKRSSDKKGEKYLTKGETDHKKMFIVVWLIVILAILLLAMFLNQINTA